MARLLGLLLLIGLALLIVKRALGARKSRPQTPAFEETVRCGRCGVHLPLSLAHREGGTHVCRDPECTAREAPEDRDRS